MADYASDLNKIRSDIDKIQNQAGKALEELNKKTRSYASSWSEVTKKVVESLDPVARINQNIAKLEAQRTDSLAKQQGFEQKREEILQKTRQYKQDLVRFQELNNIGQKNLTSAQLDEFQQLQKIYNNRDNIRKLILATYQANRKNLETTEKEIANLEVQVDAEKKRAAQLALVKDTFFKILQMTQEYDKFLSEQAKLISAGKNQIDEQYKSVQKTTGQFETNLATNRQIVDAQNKIRQSYVMSSKGAESIAKSVSQTAKSTGLTVDESLKLQETLAEISGSSLDSQNYMAGFAIQVAKATNVPLNRILKDVLNSSVSVKLIFKGNTEQLILQAAELRKIGSSLDAAAKSAESLLNFETSIGSELKLSALLGKTLILMNLEDYISRVI